MNYYLCCDISKGYCDFILLDENFNTKIKCFQLDDTPQGHKSLYNTIRNFIDKKNYTIYAGLESTGGYEDHWYNAIKNYYPDVNIKITRITGTISYLSDKITSEKAKTDATSALAIAKYLIRFGDQIDYELFDHWADLRKQWAFIRLLTMQSSQLSNHLHSLLFKYNPGIIKFTKHGFRNWLLNLLISYPTPLKIKNAKLNGLTKIPFITKSRAQVLKGIAKSDFINVPEEIGEIIKTICQQIKLNSNTKDKQLSYIKKQLSQEDLNILTSFKGIDILSGIGLLTEIGSIDRFSNVGQITAYFGLHVVYRKSGAGQYGNHLSRGGRREVKRILYMVALSALTNNIDIRRLYLRKCVEGKPSMVAIGACMRKILVIIYSMLKNKEKFESRYDKESLKDLEEKHKKITTQKRLNRAKEKYTKNRKTDSFDINAPISKKEAKLRKEYVENELFI